MSISGELRQRLRAMGVVKGVRELATLPPRRRLAIEDLTPGRFCVTAHGRCFVAEASYPLAHRHGDLPLAAFLTLSPADVAHVARDASLAGVDLRRACFFDTETTGLSGGAGTMAFVVGLGFFEGEAFHLRQYFLRDPGDEPAMIETLATELRTFSMLVSFNGRAFDAPILESRFVLARLPAPTAGLPHLDLLLPARRLWRYALSSCALTSLEKNALGVRREQDDVPSGVIPFLYRDYLRTGDAREMKRVLYHNGIDILSMVTLAARLCRALVAPWDEPGLGCAEFYALARWYADEGRLAEAERAYRAALRPGGPPEVRVKALRELALLAKQAARWSEAVACWQQWAAESPDDASPCVELAKYFEWQAGDCALAAGWTRRALAQAELSSKAELCHRLERLERKMAVR